MKKNTMMRLASALLVVVLLTTCAISGTFAKYVSSADGVDDARVAYWGWGKDADLAFDLFDNNYNGTVNAGADLDGDGDMDNLVAPGTSKSDTFKFGYVNYTDDKITAPEVDYTFEVTATITGETAQLDANPNFKWTLDGTQYNTAADLLDAIVALDGDAAKYEANTLPAGFEVDDEHTIGWTWLFETADNAETTDKNEMDLQDATDTAMGNATDLADVKITIKVTATQVD